MKVKDFDESDEQLLANWNETITLCITRDQLRVNKKTRSNFKSRDVLNLGSVSPQLELLASLHKRLRLTSRVRQCGYKWGPLSPRMKVEIQDLDDLLIIRLYVNIINTNGQRHTRVLKNNQKYYIYGQRILSYFINKY